MLICLLKISDRCYSYKGKFLHFGNAAPVAHKLIPEQFPSHEAHKILCRIGSYLQIWIKSTFTIISQGPQNSHIYPFLGFFNHPVDLILYNWNAAPVPHKFIPEQFPSHEAHKIWCRMGSYLQIWFKPTFTIVSQGPKNSHIYPFWGFFKHPVDLISSNFDKILLSFLFLYYIRLALCEGNCPGMILWGTGAASPKCKKFPL